MEEEEEEEDRNSCCWVLEQASPRQIFWYLKLFDRCSESSLPSLLDAAVTELQSFTWGGERRSNHRASTAWFRNTAPTSPHSRTLSCAEARAGTCVCARARTTTWADVGLCVGTVWLNLRQIQEHIVYPLPPFTSLFSLSADVDEDSWAASVGVFPLKLHATVDYMKSIKTG